MEKIEIINIVGDSFPGYYNYSRVACRAIIIKDDKILVSYETKNGRFMLPGGGLEDNETDIECIKREIKEETGYIIEPSSALFQIDEYYDDFKWTNRYFKAEIIGETTNNLTNLEKEMGLEPRWLPLNDVLKALEEYQNENIPTQWKGVYLRESKALKKILN